MIPALHHLGRPVEMPSNNLSAREANNPQRWSFASAGQGLKRRLGDGVVAIDIMDENAWDVEEEMFPRSSSIHHLRSKRLCLSFIS